MSSSQGRSSFDAVAKSGEIAALIASPDAGEFVFGLTSLTTLGHGPDAVQAWTDAGQVVARDPNAHQPDQQGLMGHNRASVFCAFMEQGLKSTIQPHVALSVLQSMQETAVSDGAANILAVHAGRLSRAHENQQQMAGYAQEAETRAGSIFSPE